MKMRVLQVIRQGEVGGGESHVIDLTLGLRQRDVVEPIVLAFTDGPMISLLRDAGVQCFVIATHRAFDIRVYYKIKELVVHERVDLVHAHGSRAASNMIAVCKRLDIPMLYTVHGWSFHQGQSWLAGCLRRLSEKMICSRACRVICVSQSNLQTGIEAFGLRREKCTVVENGVNLSRFNADATYPDLRSELDFKADDFVCAFICRITAQKGPLDFVEAVIQAHERNPHIRALMVGDGDMATEVHTYIKEHACEGCFVHLPFRDDVPALLAAADLFCLPSLWEGLSIAMLEAMAMRKPVVVTLTDGARDLIQDHRNALVVPPSQPSRLAEAILEASESPELCLRMGQRACALVRQRFDAARVADQVADIYASVVAEA